MADNSTRKTLRNDARARDPQPTATKNTATHYTGAGDLGINELSPTEWRISDPLIADGDPAALVGFIQRVDDTFEVTNFGRPRERSYFSSFDRATASLTLRPTPNLARLR
ncbi:MAG: hypothetical protein LH624_14290 [Cryobacterium sp.]|nr:hypothetical protein [Cryobacterium sp.]